MTGFPATFGDDSLRSDLQAAAEHYRRDESWIGALRISEADRQALLIVSRDQQDQVELALFRNWKAER